MFHDTVTIEQIKFTALKLFTIFVQKQIKHFFFHFFYENSKNKLFSLDTTSSEIFFLQILHNHSLTRDVNNRIKNKKTIKEYKR